MQIAEWVEDQILNGNIGEGDKIPSQVELAELFLVNPLTAGKGIALLKDRGIIEKRRGLGMYLAPDAKRYVYASRCNALDVAVATLLDEAKKLNMSKQELCAMIKNFEGEQ